MEAGADHNTEETMVGAGVTEVTAEVAAGVEEGVGEAGVGVAEDGRVTDERM